MRDFDERFWWDILIRHFDETVWWDILWDIFMKHFNETFWWNILMDGNGCKFVLDMTIFISHKVTELYNWTLKFYSNSLALIALAFFFTLFSSVKGDTIKRPLVILLAFFCSLQLESWGGRSLGNYFFFFIRYHAGTADVLPTIISHIPSPSHIWHPMARPVMLLHLLISTLSWIRFS